MKTSGTFDLSTPHKGRFVDWTKMACEGGLGYYYTGVFVDHLYFRGERGHTSFVVRQEGNEIETNNSRYTLIEVSDLKEYKARLRRSSWKEE